MKRILLVLLVLVLLCVVITPALAQDTTPTPPVLDVPTPEQLAQTLASAFLTALAVVLASPVTSAAVSLVKRLPVKFIQDASGEVLNMTVATVLVLLVWGAQFLGVRAELDTLFKVILALAVPTVGVISAARSSAGWYNNVAAGLPLLGTGRDGVPAGRKAA